jgi:hypothetical protein
LKTILKGGEHLEKLIQILYTINVNNY